MREEHAKVAYQFRGIINELYLTDLKKKTHRGQMGQILRGFSVGSRGYGYDTVPVGESKYDKKGRLRADGFKLVIIPEEAQIIRRIFKATWTRIRRICCRARSSAGRAAGRSRS